MCLRFSSFHSVWFGLIRYSTKNYTELVFSQHGRVKKAKIYRDDAGQAKGDGLVTYAKAACVDLAVATVRR